MPSDPGTEIDVPPELDAALSTDPAARTYFEIARAFTPPRVRGLRHGGHQAGDESTALCTNARDTPREGCQAFALRLRGVANI